MKEKRFINLFLGGVTILTILVTMAQGVGMVLQDRIHLGPVLFIAAVIVLVGVAVLQWGYLHLVQIGILNFSSEFNEDEEAWGQAKKSLICVMHTGYSIIERFLVWCEKNQGNLPARIKFYLIDPEDEESLRLIAAHRAGRPAAPNEIEQLRNEIRAGFGRLQTCTAAVEVVFYKITSNLDPFWIYLVDEEKIWLGFPAPGKNGLKNSPAYLITKRPGKYGFFDIYAGLLVRLETREGR